MDILTRQENRVAKLIAEEQSEKMIADILFISPKTVPVHKKNIRKKLGVKTNVGIAVKYLQSLEHPKKFALACFFLSLQFFAIVAQDNQVRVFRSGRRFVKVRRYATN